MSGLFALRLELLTYAYKAFLFYKILDMELECNIVELGYFVRNLLSKKISVYIRGF